MALRRPELILLDLDGTMVDSVPDLANAVDEMMARLGMPARGRDSVRLWIGNGAERLVKRALTDSMDGEPDPELFRRALAVFMETYETHATAETRLFQGVRPALDALAAAGYRLACVTNKPARFTGPLLEALGIHGYFALVVAGDTLAQQKPHPAPLLYAAEFFRIPVDRALMVGDSENDVRAARAAGFQVACVTYGYNHGQDIRAADPDAVIESLEELPGLLAGS